jgi:hypothetical protein
MNKNSSTALGLTLAIALTTGTVLVKHPPATGNKAPGAYSDITIVQDDSERVVPPPSPDNVPGVAPSDATVPRPVVMIPVPEKKNTGDPDTPDPTRNTPGAETKN